MTHKTWKAAKGISGRKKEKSFPLGEYIKFYCYDNIKHENRKCFSVTLPSSVSSGARAKARRRRVLKGDERLGMVGTKEGRVSGKIKLLIAANNQLLISSSWECFAGGVNEY